MWPAKPQRCRYHCPLANSVGVTAAGTDFSVTADIGDLLSKYGPGVYTNLAMGEGGWGGRADFPILNLL